MDNTSMREALEAARDLLLPQCNGGTAFAKACGETVNKIMDALSAPPRNCDRFGGDIDKLREACLRERGLNPEEDFPDVFPDWLLAPSTANESWVRK